ncbi:MAG: hypothetical protein OHK93_001069 [Ramalina farinacea]|uniref:Chitin synthesis regulation, Congo red resistance, RCR protein n=1 Tax=Ramalina farinacea TaxID=258253 RepID=A0AA43TXB3_9LECA|nr:hypothetical protein [Ramalina farinacea]
MSIRIGCNNGYYGNDYGCDGYSPWYSYGRWILLAAIIVGAFLIFLLFACITARRRRRRGMQPFRGTGWASGQTAPGHGAPQYAGPPPPQYGGTQPPQYSSPPPAQGYGYGQNQYGGANQGYFGGQQNGVELQQPNQAYQPQRGGDSVYTPPAGPPPGKGGMGSSGSNEAGSTIHGM